MSQQTEEGLRKTLEAAIRKLYIVDDRISTLDGWGSLEHRLLMFCLQSEITDKTHLMVIMRLRLQELGRESFDQHIITDERPDHVVSPHALAFAMRTGALAESEINQIEFDHGDTKDTFMRGVEKTLLETIWKRLVDPPAPLAFPDPGDICVTCD